MFGMTLKFCLPLTSVNNLISESCDMLCFSVGVGAPGQLCPLHLLVIIRFHCSSLLEYNAVYSGGHVLMFHGNLVPSESPFSETSLHIQQKMVVNLYTINSWKQLRMDRSVAFSVCCSDMCYIVTSQYPECCLLKCHNVN